MEVTDHIAVIAILLLVGIYPIFDAKRFKDKLEGIEGPKSGNRIKLYWEILFWLWGTSALVIGFWVYKGFSFYELGFRYENTLRFWVTLGIVLVLSIIILSNYFRLKNSPKARIETLAALNKTSAIALIPRTKKELKYFSLCSFSASSEEIVYRGFILWYLTIQTNIIAAGVVSSLLFSLAHSYQGKTGIIQTGIYGVVLLALYLVSNSLWPPIILHITQDLYGGLAGYVSFTMPTESIDITPETAGAGCYETGTQSAVHLVPLN